MTKYKYNDGDVVGDNGVILYKRLYKKYPRIWFGEFICPYCKKHFIARIDSVYSNRTKSCGCFHREQSRKNGKKAKEKTYHNLQGKTFHYLQVLEEDTDENLKQQHKRKGVWWKCKCLTCGRIVSMNQDALENKDVRSCGCLKISKGEEKISNLLSEMNICFSPQHIFCDCKNPKTNRPLVFDFYLPDYNCCIEYDGKQHYSYRNTGWGTKENFEAIQQRDKIKNIYCEKKNIYLLRIPYTDYNKLDKEYIANKITRRKND